MQGTPSFSGYASIDSAQGPLRSHARTSPNFTPCAVISPRAMYCQEKNEVSRNIFAFRRPRAALLLREEHIARLFSPAPAILPVKNHIIRENVVPLFETERPRCPIDRARRPFQLEKYTNGCLVQFDQQPFRPALRARQPERRAKLFILKPPAHSQSFEDPRQRFLVGNLQFSLFSHFVPLASNARACRTGWPLEAHQVA